MPAARTRRLLRSALLLAILGGVGALIGITVVSRPGEPKAEATEGWTVRGFRQTRYDGGTPVLSVSAEEARLERPRFGPFRIGVARRLVVHEARSTCSPGRQRPTAPEPPPAVFRGRRRLGRCRRAPSPPSGWRD